MKFGIIGLPETGKRTVFELLTGVTGDSAIGIGRVRDPRLEVLNDMFQPKKKTPAEIEFHLFGDLEPGKPVPNTWLAKLREMDAVCHVVRCFEDPTVFHALETVNPQRDVVSISSDLLLTDPWT